MDSILQGYLIKSPPEKKSHGLFGAKWRRRYFVLYAPPIVEGIPDAYTAILEYYTNKKLHKKCGSINLAECEEVMSSLDSEVYDHVFGLQTKHKMQDRMYYLVAATEREMNKWVNTLIRVLGLAENNARRGLPLTFPIDARFSNLGIGSVGARERTVKPPVPSTARPPKPTSPDGSSNRATCASMPFSLLNTSEPNLLDVGGTSSKRGMTIAVTGSRGMRSANSVPELDQCGSSPSTRNFDINSPREKREFMKLPPRPDEITRTSRWAEGSEESYDVPPQQSGGAAARNDQRTATKHPASRSGPQDTYDMPPKHNSSQDETYDKPPKPDETYDMPPKHGMPRQDETYDMPPKHGMPRQDETYDMPPKHGMPRQDETYDMPPKHGMPRQDETYDMPPKHAMPRPDETYDMPPKHAMPRQDETYDMPPKLATSRQDETYDMPPKKIVPKLPPKKSPRNNSGSCGAEDDVVDPDSQNGVNDWRAPALPKKTTASPHISGQEVCDVSAPERTRPIPAHRTSLAGKQNKLTASARENLPASGDSEENETYDTPPAKPTRRPGTKTSRQSEDVGTVGTETSECRVEETYKSSVTNDEKTGKERTVGLTAKTSKTYKQNETTSLSSQPSYLSKKQQQAPPAPGVGLAIKDSIRFTQRSKSFKRTASSLRAAQTSALPVVIKRLPAAGSANNDSSSSSDDIDDE